MSTFLIVALVCIMVPFAMMELVIIADKKGWTWLVSEPSPEMWDLEQSLMGRGFRWEKDKEKKKKGRKKNGEG